MSKFKISSGFTEQERPDIARLYWQAFSAKLGRLLGPTPRALAFFEHIISPDFALVARSPAGKVIGVAGFKTAEGALTGGGLRELSQYYGWLGASWRAPFLHLLERDLAENTLLMDGICVDAAARGLGVGTALLDAIKAHAQSRNLAHVRLDVIDINPRARALYLREGFIAAAPQHVGPLRWLFGFSTSTPMTWTVDHTCRIAAN
ncbi:ribosomal protein S18 acetylase RimI-like enzyme [Sulfitobacter undariae]|uniref:Ribosomal protein S18 acetylase RimI-like enzyme n=1 Tax=Sulfitobacter undariae TaxID=1563671 RepID=A0A7W6E5C8_9RHOB|nr:ribosomal protein S18 acetylase RimI-like enzyme [Sulfitobacter undariae]